MKLSLVISYQLTVIILSLITVDYLKEREKTKQIVGENLIHLVKNK
jgi:hypothetical protein